MKRSMIFAICLLLLGCQNQTKPDDFDSTPVHQVIENIEKEENKTSKRWQDETKSNEMEVIEDDLKGEDPSAIINEVQEETVQPDIIPPLEHPQEINMEDTQEETISNDEQEEIILAHPSYSERDIIFDENKCNIYLFWGNGCGHCEHLFEYFTSLNQDLSDQIQLYSFEVWYDEDNNALMHQMASHLGDEVKGVPYMIIGDESFIGYDTSIDEDLTQAIEKVIEDPVDLYFEH